jgi:hypothetical protein
MAHKRWDELSPRSQRLVMVGAGFETVLKVAALIDLARRPADEIRGSKARWATAVVLINSMGVVPLAYFTLGRVKPS